MPNKSNEFKSWKSFYVLNVSQMTDFQELHFKFTDCGIELVWKMECVYLEMQGLCRIGINRGISE